MIKVNYIDIKDNKGGEHFNKKALMLNLDINKQCELLNQIYNGVITFKVMGETSIVIVDIKDRVRIMELPECKYLDLYSCHNYYTNNTYFHNVETLKIPKCIDKVDLAMLKWRFPDIKSVWLWEHQEVTNRSMNDKIPFQMLVFKNKDTGKSRVIRGN